MLVVTLAVALAPGSVVLPPSRGALPLSRGAARGCRCAKPPAEMAGFGAPKKAPPTLEEVVRGFGNRLPKDFDKPCACGSGVAYAKCCRPYHAGEARAETATRCLQARWSAFACKLPLYIMESTDQSNPDHMKDRIKWAKKLHKTSMFDNFDFALSSLGVGEEEPGEDGGEVWMNNEFHLATKNSAAPAVVTYERTRFVRRGDEWRFASGAVSSEVMTLLPSPHSPSPPHTPSTSQSQLGPILEREVPFFLGPWSSRPRGDEHGGGACFVKEGRRVCQAIGSGKVISGIAPSRVFVAACPHSPVMSAARARPPSPSGHDTVSSRIPVS